MAGSGYIHGILGMAARCAFTGISTNGKAMGKFLQTCRSMKKKILQAFAKQFIQSGQITLLTICP